jgi:NAD(P)-dependent dehydrogenase (short-subunit alcohol dehydrogenase family)
MNRLNGKTAVITGGATGIGRAAAKRFIEEGAFVFIFGRRREALDAAAADLGPNARAVRGSVSDLADLDRLYAAVKAERGTLDIVFANAGAGRQGRLGEITTAHIDETFDTNVVFASMTPLHRMADPAEIGAVAAFLASSDSSFMTGSEVAADGGLAQL